MRVVELKIVVRKMKFVLVIMIFRLELIKMKNEKHVVIFGDMIEHMIIKLEIRLWKETLNCNAYQ